MRQRSREHDPQKPSRPRSLSRKLHRRRRPMKAAARDRAYAPVRVFSRSAGRWVDAEIVEFEPRGFLRIEYGMGDNWFGKTLPEHSAELIFLSTVCSSEAIHMELAGVGKSASIEMFRDDALRLTSSHFLHSSSSVLSAFNEVDPEMARPAWIFQGNRKEEPATPAEMYVEWDFFFDYVKKAGITFISGRWLLEQRINPSFRLPCWQDLPPEARIDVEDMIAFIEDQIVVISHCWLGAHLDPPHPDPDGLLLQELCAAIELKLHALQLDEIAIFLSWCSVKQLGATPTDAELVDFKWMLDHMDIMYTHTCTEKWLFKSLHSVIAGTYDQRGWTFWEEAVAKLATDPSGLFTMPIDAVELWGSAQGSSESCGEFEEGGSGKDESAYVPSPPDEFKQVIRLKRFTEANDLESITKNYERNYSNALSCMQRMCYTTSNISDRDATKIARILPDCSNLGELRLDNNSITDAGLEPLVGKLPRCLRELNLGYNLIEDVGVKALARVLPHCQSLTKLRLNSNRIEDSGAEAFVGRFPYNLVYLDLSANSISEKALAKLHADWQKIAKIHTTANRRLAFDGQRVA